MPRPLAGQVQTVLGAIAPEAMGVTLPHEHLANLDMALTNLQPQIRKVFDIIHALPSLNVFESVDELDRYLASIQCKVRDQGEP